MIGTGYVKRMARYNRWQNENLYFCADRLSDEARRQDRAAFFGSIHGTDGTQSSPFQSDLVSQSTSYVRAERNLVGYGDRTVTRTSVPTCSRCALAPSLSWSHSPRCQCFDLAKSSLPSE